MNETENYGVENKNRTMHADQSNIDPNDKRYDWGSLKFSENRNCDHERLEQFIQKNIQGRKRHHGIGSFREQKQEEKLV